MAQSLVAAVGAYTDGTMAPNLQVWLIQNAMRIVAIVTIIVTLVTGYYYIYYKGYNTAVAEYTIKSDKALREREKEISAVTTAREKQLRGALEVYAKHSEDLRAAADRIPERVFINAQCNTGPVSRATEGRPAIEKGSTGSGKAELPNSNIRELNKTISMIEVMQLKCERLLNSVD